MFQLNRRSSLLCVKQCQKKCEKLSGYHTTVAVAGWCQSVVIGFGVPMPAKVISESYPELMSCYRHCNDITWVKKYDDWENNHYEHYNPADEAGNLVSSDLSPASVQPNAPKPVFFHEDVSEMYAQASRPFPQNEEKKPDVVVFFQSPISRNSTNELLLDGIIGPYHDKTALYKILYSYYHWKENPLFSRQLEDFLLLHGINCNRRAVDFFGPEGKENHEKQFKNWIINNSKGSFNGLKLKDLFGVYVAGITY
jgi:hypothetical protein